MTYHEMMATSVIFNSFVKTHETQMHNLQHIST